MKRSLVTQGLLTKDKRLEVSALGGEFLKTSVGGASRLNPSNLLNL